MIAVRYKIRFFILGVLLFSFSATCLFSSIKIYLLGKMNLVRAAGSESDYEVGVNEFPLAAAHTTYGFGAGVSSDYGAMFFGFETHFNFGGTATLTDPSDNDTVDIDTYKYISGLFIVGLNIVHTSQLRLFIQGGGGVNYTLNAQSKLYTSRENYETQIDPPDNRFPISALGGAGIELDFSDRVGLMFISRYEYLALDQPQSKISVLMGLIFSF